MEKIIVLITFILTYLSLLLLPKYRAYLALGAAAFFVGYGLMFPTTLDALTLVSAIDWNVILMIAGTMIVVSYFIESKAPVVLADLIIDRVSTVKWAVIALAFFSGLISAFIDNVATVLIVAPIATTIAKRLKISPVPMIIAITVSANLQGFATLVGDTTSIILASTANLNFADFFFLQGRIGPFFVVQIGALSTIFVMLSLFKNLNQPMEKLPKEKMLDVMPSVFLILIVALLITVSFIPNRPALSNGLVTMGVALVASLYQLWRHRSVEKIKDAFGQIDFNTLGLLIGLFMVIATLNEVGLIADIAQLFIQIGGANPFVMFSMAVWVSVLLSAFIDNIPYVATMLPVMAALAPDLGVNPLLLYFGLLAGATLGGNLTPIGASANIAGIGILRNEGFEVKFATFAKIAIPITLAAVTSAYVLLWILWA
ncbi:MAG: SLC13 family permease [Bacilli bacterium]